MEKGSQGTQRTQGTQWAEGTQGTQGTQGDTGDTGNSHDRTHRASTVFTAYKSSVHWTSIPNIPLPKSRWLFFPPRPVRRLNPLLCQEWCQYIENKPENAGRKTWRNYFLFFLKEDVNRRKRRLNMIRRNSFKSLCLSVAFENIKMCSN